MQCDEIWDLLSPYADGEASPNEAVAVDAHVAECAACAADLRFLQSTSAALSGMPEVEPPAYLREAILGATVFRPRWSDRLAGALQVWSGRRTGLGLAGAAAVVLLICLFAMRHDSGIGVAPG